MTNQNLIVRLEPNAFLFSDLTLSLYPRFKLCLGKMKLLRFMLCCTRSSRNFPSATGPSAGQSGVRESGPVTNFGKLAGKYLVAV